MQTKELLREQIEEKLHRHFGCTMETSQRMELFRAVAMVMQDKLTVAAAETREKQSSTPVRQVHYLSLEFLMGRSFLSNAYNLGILEELREILEGVGISISELSEAEPDAGLGNGGLGRLAACYLDSMASLGINGTGYSIRYEQGLFKQKILEGQQIELPDSWLDVGEVWLEPRPDEVREVYFGGSVEEEWEYGHMRPVLKNATKLLAVPYDMIVCGKGNDHTCTLRLWSARSPVEVDLNLFSRGQYLNAVEQQAMAEAISKILYPDDSHIEGKTLRLKQQYFFVSATVQDIVRKHKQLHGTLYNFADYHVIQMNDTHPVLVIPELMRIFMDEEYMSWEDAWRIVTHTVAYTNHTVLPEALEQWPQSLIENTMPRIWAILREINERWCAELWNRWPGDFTRISCMAILADSRVRMANLAVAAGFRVNGVSALHSRILREKVFPDFYEYTPDKFTNVTNGIAHRRWLCECNPALTALMRECIGDRFLTEPGGFADFARFADDTQVRSAVERIKGENKARLAAYLRSQGTTVDTSALFDVQVKRLHEYKRQLLNVLRIIDLYLRIKENPQADWQPRVFLFGAKAFPGYVAAKQIIQLINSVAAFIAADPLVSRILQVVFMENYRVTLAERIMPAAELSEQISTAGKEASGTGNMKFMMNGALTIGTLDGANVEMSEAVGRENFFLFGLTAEEVSRTKLHYSPAGIYTANPRIRAVLDLIARGFNDGADYRGLVESLLVGPNPDAYLLLADFDSYVQAQAMVDEAYRDRPRWNRMSIINIAASGRFCSDRSVAEYAANIWNVPVEYPPAADKTGV